MRRYRTSAALPTAMRGFTLLELLVSMTVVSLLMTTILFAWRITASAWQKAETHLRVSRTVLESDRLLMEQMSSLAPYQAIIETSGPEWFFQGEPESLRFVSRYSLQGRASSGLYRVEYQIVEQGDGTKQLLMNEIPIRSRQELGAAIAGSQPTDEGRVLIFAPFANGSATRVLMGGLAECRFEYFEPAQGSTPGRWRERWIATTGKLPASIAIRVVNKDRSADLQPVSLVADIRNSVTTPYPRPR